MASKEFKVGDLVWAKMKGFPFWPGEIMNPPNKDAELKQKKGHHYVYFYGAQNYASISDEKIEPHSKETQKKYASAKIKSEDFLVGVEVIKIKFKDKNEAPKRQIKINYKNIGTRKKIATKHKIACKGRPPKRRKTSQDDEAGGEMDKPTEGFLTKSTTRKNLKKSQNKPYRSKKSSKLHIMNSAQLSAKVVEPSSPQDSFFSKSIEIDYSSSQKHLEKGFPFNLSSSEIEEIIQKDYRYIISNFPLESKNKSVSVNFESNVNNLSRSFIKNLCTERPPSPQINLKEINETLIAKNIQPTDKKIGFLGLGKMGQSMVKNLIQSGHCVTIWNRTVEKCNPFLEIGAILGTTPADVVLNSDIIFCCVSDSNTVKGLIFGSNGVIKAMENSGSNKGYVEMTSIEPYLSQVISDDVTAKGGRYLEVSLLGSRQECIEGTLLILGAGDETLFTDCQSCFDVIGRETMFVGPILGTALKLSTLYNTFFGTLYGALAETLYLSNCVGLDQKLMLKVLQHSLSNDKNVLSKGYSMINKEYTSNIPLNYVQRCMESGLAMGIEANQPTVISSAANDLYKYVMRCGFEKHDVSAVYEGTRAPEF